MVAAFTQPSRTPPPGSRIAGGQAWGWVWDGRKYLVVCRGWGRDSRRGGCMFPYLIVLSVSCGFGVLWIGAYVREEVVELLMVGVFTQPSRTPPPGSRIAGGWVGGG